MKDEEIEGLLDQASALYNDGRYDDAIAIWQKILSEHPDHERALEGIKMAQLLTSDWERAATAPPADSPPGESDLDERVREGIQRVHELLAAGDLASAKEGVEALLAVAPDDAGVAAVAAEVQAASNPQGYIEEQLALARHYMLQGETEEAAEACRRVLAIDPGNATAAELLREGPARPGELDLSLDSALPGTGDEPPPDVDSIPLDLSDEVEGMSVESIDAGALELNDLAAEAAPAAGGGDPKVASLLNEGDRLLAEGRIEEAIDAWSRIFVLQDDNADAERRIDEARQQLDRRARKMEEHLTRGEDLISKGLPEDARLEFEAVLRIRPGHAEASSRIQFLDQQRRGGSPAAPAPAAPTPPVAPTAAPSPKPPAHLDAPSLAVQEESKLPTPPPAPPKRPVRAAPAPKKMGTPVLAAGAVLVLALAAGGTYLAWQKLFPPPPGPTSEGAAPPAQSPEGDAAPAGAAEPEVGAAPRPAPTTAAPEVATPQPSPPQSEAERKQLAAAARKEGVSRFRAGDFEAATARLQEALDLDPTDFETQDWLTKAEAEWNKVKAFEEELGGVRQGFEDRDYRAALYKLYRIEAPDARAKSKVERWITTCWYDWGVMLLKAGNTKEAEEKFREVLDVRPQDRDAKQNLEIAQRYQERPIDQAYRTFTERLDPRPLD